jgi:cell division protein FtsN
MSKTTKKTNHIQLSNIIVGILLIIGIIIASLGLIIYFNKKSNLEKTISTQESILENNDPEELNKQITNKLSQILEVDTKNSPAIAKITDVSKLKATEADFYKNASEGDYVVIYPDKAIIFSLEENKIINVSPIINTNQNQNSIATDSDQ